MPRPDAGKKQVVISYSRADERRVTSIVSHLRALGADLSVDALDARPDQSLQERLARGGYLAAMISPSSSQSPWARRDLEHALAEEGTSGRVKVIPCVLESCELPPGLGDKQRCDFTRGLFPGMAGLVAGIEREAELITCSLDPQRPLQLDLAGLRAQLEAALLLGGARARLYFIIDAERLEQDLAPAWKNHAQAHRGSRSASYAASAELLLRNLATCLGKAAAAAQVTHSALGAGLAAGALLEELVSRAATLVLYEHWKLLRAALGDEAIRGQRAVDGAALLAALDRIDTLPGPAGLSPSKALLAELFGVDGADLVEVELRARPPLAPALATLPRGALRVDTVSVWQHGHCPPSREIAADAWPRYAMPGLVRHFACQAAMRLARTVTGSEISFAVDDYESVGPR